MKRTLQKLREIRGFPLLCAAAVLGLLLLLLPGGGEGGTVSVQEALPDEISALCAYERVVSHKIAQMTDALLGCDGTTVLLTFDSIPADTAAEAAFGLRSGTKTSAVPMPTGIAVACHGGGSAEIRLRVTEMLSAVFDLPSSRIFVGELQKTAQAETEKERTQNAITRKKLF